MSRLPRASLYVRLSKAASDTNTSRDGMVADLRSICAQRGFTEVALHVDDGQSGAIRNRPAFVSWIADATEGRADVLLTWHADRLTREGLNVAARLLDVVEGKDAVTGKVVRTPVRLMDAKGLDSNDGESFRIRFVLQAEIARAERDRIRDRTSATKRRLSGTGRFAGGPPPYGYRTAPNPDGPGRILEINPEEAAYIRAAAKHVLSGNSLYSAAKMLQTAGSTPRRASAWSLKSLGLVLTGDPVLGRVRRLGQLLRDEHGQPLQVFPAILDIDTVERLRAELEPRPRAERRRRATRLLSGLLTCHSCGSRLRVNVAGGHARRGIDPRPRYSCRADTDGRGCTRPVQIMAERIEEYVEAEFLAGYGQSEVMREVERLPEDARIRDVEQEIREIGVAILERNTDVVALSVRLIALKEERERLASQPAARRTTFVPTGQTYAQVWADASTDERRSMLSDNLTLAVILPGHRGRTGLDVSRVRLVWQPSRVGDGTTSTYRHTVPVPDDASEWDDITEADIITDTAA